MLIYRSMLEVADTELATSGAPEYFGAWLASKLRRDHDPAGGELGRDGTRYEWSAVTDTDDDASAFRGHLYEDRGNEQVRLTFSAASPANGAAVAWIDVERWTTDHFSPGWIPYAPALVSTVLDRAECAIAGTAMPPAVEVVGRGDVDDLLRRLFDPSRTVPIVVVSPTKSERDNDVAPTLARADELQRRLAGVAIVATLGPGATSALSLAMHDAVGVSFDVHSGAVRTYLPGLGLPGDQPRRHRVVPFHRLEGRPPETAARLISLPLVQAACLRPPPPSWRETTGQLSAFVTTPGADADLDELLAVAEKERDEALAEVADALARRAEERETNDELLASQDLMERRIAYLEGELAKQDPGALYGHADEDIFEPEWCEEVAQHIPDLSQLATASDLAAPAGDLDVHADNASWARKAWRALRALQAYAEDKLAGKAEGWDFKLWCEHSGSAAAIPASWVAMHESDSTDNNARFRRLRTLPVDSRVDASGSVYMPATSRSRRAAPPAPGSTSTTISTVRRPRSTSGGSGTTSTVQRRAEQGGRGEPGLKRISRSGDGATARASCTSPSCTPS